MRVPRHLFSELVREASRAAPRECCGLIAGRDGTAVAIYPAHNISVRRQRFRIAPWDHFRALRAMAARGERLLGTYHSHPRGPAQPSRTDIDFARDPDQVHLIVSLTEQAVRAFRVADGTPELVALELTEPGDVSAQGTRRRPAAVHAKSS